MSFMFNKTKHIIPNHYISHINNILVVKKCIPFKIEFVVRGYITGNTKTSLWTHYNNGIRTYCGIKFPDNLKKNQKLAEPVITPTTKDIEDIPISKEDIINKNYMTQTECDFVYKKAMELFKYGQKIADDAGFILVDTKYEFGKDENNNIILIDEIHTCDSSRYWIKKTYENRYKNDIEPEKIDKDIIRDWVKNQCNPYTDKIPEVPEDLKKKQLSYMKIFIKILLNLFKTK